MAPVPSAPLMSELAIDIRGVTKRYEEHIAVRALSLQVPRGAVYGLLGPNGAGKTTTIRMILDIIAPDEGTITLFGKRHNESGVLDRIGYLPEERGLYKKMKVRDVLKFLAELKGVAGADAEKRIESWMERMSLRTPEKDWGDKKVDELSRGMQQKVQFIGTLLHDPDLVILDEPFSGLDPINAQALKDTVVDLKARGKTVIFSTHIMDNAEKLCDAVCILANGAKVLDGAVSDVKAAHAGRTVAVAFDGAPTAAVDAVLRNRTLVASMDDQIRYLELELAAGASSRDLLQQLMTAGATLQRFERVQPSLHRIFLEKVGATGVEAGMSGHG
jgi:ABC-2 type transport system ATP-binding protein